MTAQQIAKKVGLSNATVSRVLNNSQYVRPEAREAVLAAVRESGVPPRLLGRRPSGNGIKTAAPQLGLVQIVTVVRFPIVVVDQEEKLPPKEYFSPQARLATSYTRHIIDGVLGELPQFGMRAIVQVTEDIAARSLLAEVNRADNRGLFLLGIHGSDVDEFIGKVRCPIVSFMNWPHGGGPDYVGIENRVGIRLGFAHLRELGHTRIGYVAGQLKYSQVFAERLAAYKTCLVDAELPFRGNWVVEGDCDVAPIEARVKQLLSRPDRPTAILCAFDAAAIAVKRAADACGLRVPRDLSVIGFDDDEIAQLFTPALTTVRVPTLLMGRHGVHLMAVRQQMQVKLGEGCNLRVKPSLIVRESTAPPSSV